jgi:redox-sensitive bicupin YhaK (pirin superfamily)
MKIIRAKERYHLESDWLSAYWLFSFDHYYDPANVQFGPLRVFNHDWIRGGAGFPTHSHREMEIVTYVLEGALAHRDSTGGEGIIHPGEVQRMTAGTGIAHSEMNADPLVPVRLLQMWVLPSQRALAPSYEQRQFTREQRTGRLLPIASGQGHPGAVHIHQEATFYVGYLRAGDGVETRLDPGRRGFLYLIEGELEVNGERLAAGDQARIEASGPLSLVGQHESELLWIDLP